MWGAHTSSRAPLPRDANELSTAVPNNARSFYPQKSIHLISNTKDRPLRSYSSVQNLFRGFLRIILVIETGDVCQLSSYSLKIGDLLCDHAAVDIEIEEWCVSTARIVPSVRLGLLISSNFH